MGQVLAFPWDERQLFTIKINHFCRHSYTSPMDPIGTEVTTLTWEEQNHVSYFFSGLNMTGFLTLFLISKVVSLFAQRWLDKSFWIPEPFVDQKRAHVCRVANSGLGSQPSTIMVFSRPHCHWWWSQGFFWKVPKLKQRLIYEYIWCIIKDTTKASLGFGCCSMTTS